MAGETAIDVKGEGPIETCCRPNVSSTGPCRRYRYPQAHHVVFQRDGVAFLGWWPVVRAHPETIFANADRLDV